MRRRASAQRSMRKRRKIANGKVAVREERERVSMRTNFVCHVHFLSNPLKGKGKGKGKSLTISDSYSMKTLFWILQATLMYDFYAEIARS
jgi:hypothetical protein